MLQLLIGLALFLGIHSLQSLAPQVRQSAQLRLGVWGYKAVYASIATLGFYMIVQGYGLARVDTVQIWTPPPGIQHGTLLLMWFAMVLLVASYVPSNHIKAKLRHPMTLSVKIWAFAHLLANGGLSDMLLFGSFLMWAVLVFRAARQRDRLRLNYSPEGTALGTWLAVLLGTALWGAFVVGDLHLWLIGMNPLVRSG
jgi:uncharacterized membrane protein